MLCGLCLVVMVCSCLPALELVQCPFVGLRLNFPRLTHLLLVVDKGCSTQPTISIINPLPSYSSPLPHAPLRHPCRFRGAAGA